MHQELRDAAARLGSLIVDFTEKLSARPGRCIAVVPGEGFQLRFDRHGKRWDIWFDSPDDSKLLTECSVVNKLKAVELFPDLVPAMERATNELTEQIKAANAKLARMIEEL